MIDIKFKNNRSLRTTIFTNTIKTISKYISSKLKIGDVSIISDNECVEIVTNIGEEYDEDSIVVEMLIKKVITIKRSDLNNNDKLDRFIFEVKKFCDNAERIEADKYKPINFR